MKTLARDLKVPVASSQGFVKYGSLAREVAAKRPLSF